MIEKSNLKLQQLNKCTHLRRISGIEKIHACKSIRHEQQGRCDNKPEKKWTQIKNFKHQQSS